MERMLTTGQMKFHRSKELREKLLLAQQLLGQSREDLRKKGYTLKISKEGILTLAKHHTPRSKVYGMAKIKEMLHPCVGE